MKPLLPRASVSALCLHALVLVLACLGGARLAHAQEPPPIWYDMQVRGDVAHLLRKSPSELMRYDFAQRAWLGSIQLERIPDAFALDAQYLFVASGSRIERFNAQGTAGTLLRDTGANIRGLYLDGNLLIALGDQRIWSIDRNSGALLGSRDLWYRADSASLDTQRRRLYFRSSSVSPGDILYVSYTSTGQFGPEVDSPYHGDFPWASKTFLFADGSRVADNAGVIYRASDLGYAGSFGLPVSDLAFAPGGSPVVLSGIQLRAFTPAGIQSGRFQLARAGRSLHVHGGEVFVFQENNAALPTRVSVEIVPLASIRFEPAPAPSPVGLAYEIVDSTVDADGVVNLLPQGVSAVFRWSIEDQAYLPPVALPEPAHSMTYSRALHRLFVSSQSGSLYAIDLSEPTPRAQPFQQSPHTGLRMLALGEDLITFNGGWARPQIFRPSGEEIPAPQVGAYAVFHHYQESNRRLFANSYYLTYLGNGQFTQSGWYHGWGLDPLTFSPDGQRMIDRLGNIHETEWMTRIDALPNHVSAARWLLPDALYSFFAPSDPWNTPPDTGTRLQRWSRFLILQQERVLHGAPVALHTHGLRLVAITVVGGRPRFTVLDANLGIVPPTVLATPSLELVESTPAAALLRWPEIQGATRYRVDRRLGTGAWQALALLDAGRTEFIDTTRVAGIEVSYRVLATNEALLSAPSNVVATFVPVPPLTRVDPDLVEFTPDAAVAGPRGRIYVLSNQHASVFGWNSLLQRWESSAPIRAHATDLVYAEEHNALYVLYQDRGIGQIGLANAQPWAHDLKPAGTLRLSGGAVAAGNWLIYPTSNGWSAEGLDVLGRTQTAFDGFMSAWPKGYFNPWTRRLHVQYAGGSYNAQDWSLSEAGTLSWRQIGPYTEPPLRGDIAFSADGQRLLYGSGELLDTATLTVQARLSGEPEHALWVESRILAMRGDRIRSHHPATLVGQDFVTLPHPGRALFPLDQGRFVVVMATPGGDTALVVYDADAQPVEPPIFIDGFEPDR